MRHFLGISALAIVLLGAPTVFAQKPTPMSPTTPGTSGEPAWQGTVLLSDGRKFVTDGGFAFDAAIAKPAKLPERQFPSKIVEEYLKAPHKDECRLADLVGNASGKTYRTPSGIALNATYINYLKRVLPARSVRLRMTAPMQPILVESDGKLVGVLMAVAQ